MLTYISSSSLTTTATTMQPSQGPNDTLHHHSSQESHAQTTLTNYITHRICSRHQPSKRESGHTPTHLFILVFKLHLP